MTIRLQMTFMACLVVALSGNGQLRAQSVTFIAHIADGGSYADNSVYITQVSVYNPASTSVTCTFSTFDDNGNALNVAYQAPSAPATSSVQFAIVPQGTYALETSGLGDGTANALAGSAQLNCGDTVVAGATYSLFAGNDVITGIGVPATDPTTAFRVAGGNESTAFAFYNPSQGDALDLTIQAYDGATGTLVDSNTLTILPNGHSAFNASSVLNLPSGFYGSFFVPSNGQQFVPVALGVTDTNANDAGFVLYTIPSLSGTITGIDNKAKPVH